MNFIIQNLSTIVSFAGVIITLLVAVYTKQNTNKLHFINSFKKIYERTFSLRSEISTITQQELKCDFYYETDIIMESTKVREAILDYLTEMENYFSFVLNCFTWKTFETLLSLAFYQRITALYSFVFIQRELSGNNELFKNYIKAAEKMSNVPKISKNIKNNGNKCYVGVRASDIAYSSNFFSQNVCIFSDSDTSLAIRINQNQTYTELFPYMKKQLLSIATTIPDCDFYFYNQANAYNYPEEIRKRSKCINSKEILDFFGNKRITKEWFFEHNIPVIPYETFLGNEIRYSKLTQHFPLNQAFVIQSAFGGGGIGTFYADKTNFAQIIHNLQPLQQYIVSPYIENISVNTHIFIAEKQTVLSPGSVQIIENKEHQLCYRGGDFAAFRLLSASIRAEIKKLSLKIAELMRQKGYRGIAGIDFIVTNTGSIYCCEINPRFQASTFLLDQYIQSKKPASCEATSCFELNEMAFQGGMVTSLCYEDCINSSCYYYYKDNIDLEHIKEKIKIYKKRKVEIYQDGLRAYLNKTKLIPASYLFRAVFPHAICSISPDTTLWKNDNIPISPLPQDEFELKVALLNQGIRILSHISNIKRGVYESVDIKVLKSTFFQQGRYLNCAYGIHLSEYSPFCIKIVAKKQMLFYYNSPIAEISVEENLLKGLSKQEQKILFLATDRLRIKLISGCENKNIGKGCSFCNLPPSELKFSIEEIKEALLHLKQQDIPFRHILIGGGSCLASDTWEKIIELCQFLKNDSWYSNKPISIMSMLPPMKMLAKLKDAGIDEVSFNMEIANDQLAAQLMPGKREVGKEAYYEVFKEAITLWGIGNVRTALLVGLDKEQELYNEIISLIGMDVLPCLSAFRALPNSTFAGELGPTNKYLIQVYNNSEKLIKTISGNIQELGPKCHSCRNNMLIL